MSQLNKHKIPNTYFNVYKTVYKQPEKCNKRNVLPWQRTLFQMAVEVTVEGIAGSGVHICSK